MGSRSKVALGVAVSALFLWIAFRGEDLGAIAQRLTAADPLWLAAAGGVSTAGGLIRAIRWRLLLNPTGVSTSLYARWAALNVEFMVTNVYVGRLGEVARPYALSRITPVSASAALGTVVVERSLDTLALVLLLLATLVAPGFPNDATVLGQDIGLAVSGAIVVCVIVLAAVGSLAVWPSQARGLLGRVIQVMPAGWRQYLTGALTGFLRGFEMLKDLRALLKALGWSVFLWLWMAASGAETPGESAGSRGGARP